VQFDKPRRVRNHRTVRAVEGKLWLQFDKPREWLSLDRPGSHHPRPGVGQL